ncbi:transposase [Microaceticoccus formicicus]|uniref:transposase n=1 Tax=Microaceticoccus formicicus TaxID=3118105 RepID=UPI003CD02CF9|nr:transposase [Peptoniphilaceae bacterium AMB_02]
MVSFYRKGNRYQNYDYSTANIYFITFCTYLKKSILSQIHDFNKMEKPKIILSELGLECDKVIQRYNDEFDIYIPHYVIMPNHIHLIVDLTDINNCKINYNISNIVKAIKSISRKSVSDEFLNKHGSNLWQKSFFDRIVRNDKEYFELAKYIDENPIKWNLDEYYVK